MLRNAPYVARYKHLIPFAGLAREEEDNTGKRELSFISVFGAVLQPSICACIRAVLEQIQTRLQIVKLSPRHARIRDIGERRRSKVVSTKVELSLRGQL